MKKNYYIFVMFCLGFGISGSAYANEGLKPSLFTVYLNDIAHTTSGNVRPCYPVMARFVHPDSNVTRVRMRYPYNYSMFMFFPVNKDVHIDLHENFMRSGQLSLSDFIAEDEQGNRQAHGYEYEEPEDVFGDHGIEKSISIHQTPPHAIKGVGQGKYPADPLQIRWQNPQGVENARHQQGAPGKGP